MIVEELSEKLHEWYLEACKELNPKSFNIKAQKPYSKLTEDQKFIDRFIARKIVGLIKKSNNKKGIGKCDNCGHGIIKIKEKWFHNKRPSKSMLGYRVCFCDCNKAKLKETFK